MVLSALGMALGAACSSPHDAQQLGVATSGPGADSACSCSLPIVQQPNGTIAVVLSLFPPFTPILMMLRQAMPGGVPAWQPWVGLVGVVLWTLAIAWAAARIFRVVILMQGKLPKFAAARALGDQRLTAAVLHFRHSLSNVENEIRY